MRYQEPKPISRPEAERLLASDNHEDVCRALASIALFDEELDWVFQHCIVASRHQDIDVRGLSATGLGHLARRFRRLDLGDALQCLKELALDDGLKGRVQDALDDINQFLELDPPARLDDPASNHN